MRLRYLLGALCAAFTFGATAAIPQAEQITVIEFYHAGLDHYFITADLKEIGDLDTGVHPGWTRTGYRFAAVKAGSTLAGTSPMCRFYNPDKSTHFYTAKGAECEDVKVKFPNWAFESGEVFRAFAVDPATGICPADTTATYRLYNNRSDANHRYTDQVAVFVYMIGKQFVPEGDGNPALPIAFCTPSGGDTVPTTSATAPNCTVTASTGTPAAGSTLALNSTCTNNPTTFMWMGCNSTQASCSATKSTAGAASYTLYSANAQGPGDAVTISVTWAAAGGGGGGGGGALPICSVAADTISPATGQTLTLTANCSQAPTAYNWVECNYLVQSICNAIPSCATSTTTCKVTTTIPGYARYTVSGTNGAGKGLNASPAADVYWGGTGAGGGGGGGGGGVGGGPDPIPVCSLLASNLNPLVGSNIVLSANCSGNPTSFFWSGVTCSQVQCQASSSQPGQLTYSVSGSNASGTGGVAYVTVNWGGSTPNPVPACTLSPSNASPQVGSTITITATCSNAPTTYTWTGCASTTASCTDSVSALGPKTYGLVATNANGNSPSATTSVTWVAVPTTPPVCSVSASASQQTVGQNVTLTASCNGAPTSYVWAGCTSTTSTCTATASAPGAVTYYVSGVNQFGTGLPAGAIVAWTASGGGGGGGGANLCGPGQTLVEMPIAWGDYGRKVIGQFTAETVIAMEFTVPASPASYGTAGNSSLAEYQGPPNLRYMSISESKCDFRNPDPTGKNGPLELVYGTAPLITWNVGAPPFALVPGRTYYINFKNDGCGQGNCGASTSTNWPH